MPDEPTLPPNKGAKKEEITEIYQIIEIFGLDIISDKHNVKLAKLLRYAVKEITELKERVKKLEK